MTNALSKFENANANEILKNAVLNLTKFCEKNPKFSVINQYRVREDNVVLLDNNSFYNLIQKGKERWTVRGSDGANRTYIYDEKDGIYKTKRKTYILAPHIYMVYQLRITFGISIDMEEYWDNYSGKDKFQQECADIRNSLHTGNHHRNKFNRVPQSVYGMR